MIIITLDVDWAPDPAIDAAAAILLDHGVAATWMVTHRSPAVERIGQHSLFELGLHPNFLPDSSQGRTPTEVLQFVVNLVPGARSFRTHAVVQSGPLLEQITRETSLSYDATPFLTGVRVPHPARQHTPSGALLRFATFWADDHESVRPGRTWKLDFAAMEEDAAPFVLDFHPVHIWLNTCDWGTYEARKRDPLKWSGGPPDDPGAGTLFRELVQFLAAVGGGRTLADAALQWEVTS
jgi:hypothetical protein